MQIVEKERKLLEKEQKRKNKSKKKEIAKEEAQAAKDAPYVHKGKKSIDKFAKVKHTTEHQYIDYHGKAAKTIDSQVPALDVASGIMFPLP